MKAIGRVLDTVVEATTILGGLAIVAMMLHVVADVTMRYVFSSPLPGTISIVSYYYMVIATFIPLAYAEKLDAHISVEVVFELLPAWMKSVSIWLTAIVTTGVLALMTVKSWDVAVSKYHLGAKIIQGTAVLPIWQGYFLVPIGLALMILMVVAKALRIVVADRASLEAKAVGDE